MKKRLVSIITPCYNSEKYIGNLINSIINQTYTNLEFIIIDDGSKDNTENVVKTYIKDFTKRNIKFNYIKQKNKGQAAAINNALQYVHGEYLLILPSVYNSKTGYIDKEELSEEERERIEYYKTIPFDYANFEKKYEKDSLKEIENAKKASENYYNELQIVYNSKRWKYTN